MTEAKTKRDVNPNTPAQVRKRIAALRKAIRQEERLCALLRTERSLQEAHAVLVCERMDREGTVL